jgi:transposase
LVPKCKTSGAKAAGRFDRADFIFDAENNEYKCPAGQRLIWRYSTVEREMELHRYWSSYCQQCELKAQCTPGEQRRITRWEHEEVLDAMQTRLDNAPDAMRLRRQTVEHPYGTLKAWMGATHFLTKQLKNVSTEMSLHVLAYNRKRVMNIMGTPAIIEAIRA